jgi:hypothetical protein
LAFVATASVAAAAAPLDVDVDAGDVDALLGAAVVAVAAFDDELPHAPSTMTTPRATAELDRQDFIPQPPLLLVAPTTGAETCRCTSPLLCTCGVA